MEGRGGRGGRRQERGVGSTRGYGTVFAVRAGGEFWVDRYVCGDARAVGGSAKSGGGGAGAIECDGWVATAVGWADDGERNGSCAGAAAGFDAAVRPVFGYGPA